MLDNICMDLFDALADSNRRRILETLAAHGKLTSTDISKKFKVTPSAISQHLKILKEAKLVEMEKQAQKHLYSVNPQGLSELEMWTRRMAKAWEGRFGRLDKMLFKMKGGDKRW